MLETAVKSTPTATPTKPGKQQDKEIQDFKDEVWSKYYKLRDESLRVDNDSDHDMDNTIEISEVFWTSYFTDYKKQYVRYKFASCLYVVWLVKLDFLFVKNYRDHLHTKFYY